MNLKNMFKKYHVYGFKKNMKNENISKLRNRFVF